MFVNSITFCYLHIMEYDGRVNLLLWHLGERCACMPVLSCLWLFAIPWTIACQAPLSMQISRQEYWSRLPYPTSGDLPHQERKPAFLTSLALAGRFFTLRHLGSPIVDGPITCSADVFLIDVNSSLFVFKNLYKPLKLSPSAKLFCPKWSMTEFKFHMDIFSSVAVIIFHSDFFLNPFNPFLYSSFDILSLWGKLPSLWAADYPHHYLSISGPCLTSSWSPA